MPITLITGPANAGKAELVIDGLRGQLARGEEPLLIVPTRADVEHYLRELAGERAAIGVRVERFAGLLGEVVRRAGGARPLLGGLAREQLLQALLVADAPADGTAVGAGRAPGGLARALSELLGELQVRRVSPSRLERAFAQWRAADGEDAPPLQLAQLYDAYRAALRRLGREDEEQRAVRALDLLRERPALWGRTPVSIYGFDDLTALQLDAIETLGVLVGAELTVSLPYEGARAAFAGRAGTFQTLSPLCAEHRRLEARSCHYAPHARRALSHLERSLFEPGAARVDAGSAVRLLEGGGERAELELVAGEAAALLARGVPAERIAVLARPAGTSMELLAEVFTVAGVPHAIQRTRPFADSATGAALVGLLRCVPDPARSDLGGLDDLLAWLRAPGLLEHASLADALELQARRLGASSATQARGLWEQRNWPLEVIDRLAEAQRRGPAALLERAGRELYWLFCAPRRASAAVLSTDQSEEAEALAAGRRALGELRDLARGAPELAPHSAHALAELLAAVPLREWADPVPGAVAVLDPLALRARRVAVLFVCGLQEGAFPAAPRPQPLLGEEDRRRLAEVAGLRLGEQDDRSQAGQLAAERYLLYAALSRPEEQLILSWHAADDDGQASSRSLFVDDVCDLFEQRLSAERARRPLGAVDDLASVVSPSPSTRLARASHEPLRDRQLLEELAARPWSASSLEKRIACPVAWFVERILRPGVFEPDPEPLARGALAHAALKDTLEALRIETGSARLRPSVLPRARELLDGALATNEAEHPLSVAPERRVAVRRRLQADLQRYLTRAAEHESPLEPVELELGFGFDEGDERGESSSLPAFELGGGLRLRGRIDRIDVGAQGEAVVYDYKGKEAPPAARWLAGGKLQLALYMRAAEELLGLRVVGGLYQPLTGEDLRARGAFEREAELELDSVATDARDHDELRELLAEALASALEAAEQANGGALDPRPQTCAWKGGCMYPTICRCER